MLGVLPRGVAMLPNDSSALIGRTIAGKFVVESVIAVGGIGTVYRARQLALDRTVAIKVLHAEIAREEKFIERFKREARAASRLDHPNSVRVLDFGQEGDSLLYLAMEYVEGRTLYDVIQKDWPLADKRVVDIMSQVLAAVGVAHDMEVIHRDLKPENIMIIRGTSDEGEHAELAKVCDFGIATLGTMVRDGEATRDRGASGNEPRIHHRDAGIHVARTGDGRGGGSTQRSLRSRGHAVPDAGGAGSLRRPKPVRHRGEAHHRSAASSIGVRARQSRRWRRFASRR